MTDPHAHLNNPFTILVTTLVIVLATTALVTTSVAQVPAEGTLRRPVDAPRGPVVVPDRFLRSWDPVTIFFDEAVGEPVGTPEDRPGRWVTMAPAHPGAFTWLDPKTLQFRPADPWSPLERFVVTVESTGGRDRPRSFTLQTLMSPPIQTIPTAGRTGLDPVEAITLTFRDSFDAEDLARMVTVELRPLPGLGDEGARWLTQEDFDIKVIERKSRSENTSFVLGLETPIPAGTRAIVHQRLSLDDTSERSFAEFAFSTVEPFRALAMGTHGTRFPLTPGGSRYTADQAINGGSERRSVVLELSAKPQDIGPVEGRNLVRFSPSVANLQYTVRGKTLVIDGDFDWETLYRVTLAVPDGPANTLRDSTGRTLDLRGPSEVYVHFPRRSPYLKWLASQGVVERFGPQRVPVEGRGHERFDLRIHPVDPLDRSFWPFPGQPVAVDETQRPPGPGEAPEPFARGRHPNATELRGQLAALGSPPVSAMVELPLRREGSSATFGLDLAPHLGRLAAPRAPGHYLVGLRPLDASSARHWMRIQVTDLSLTTVEHRQGHHLVVTSLSSGRPVAGASITVEGTAGGDTWIELASGTTDATGGFAMDSLCHCKCSAFRIVVRHGDDVLALDARQPPETFANNAFTDNREPWLHCTPAPPGVERVSHLFTERPIYRPEETVYLKGYVRERLAGRLRQLPLDHTFLVIQGPGNLEWRYAAEVSDQGSFDGIFEESDRPTGTYTAHLEGRVASGPDRGETFRSREVKFELEAFRIPRFEVDLHADDRVPLDREFTVGLTATYYAGGRVADRPVRFRVTQFPYTWRPGRSAFGDGFFFSSDSRFSSHGRFEATAAVDREDRTSDDGSARIALNPALEATAQPRTYTVEATVTGADDQTVTATRRVIALPPFILGLKVPRYLDEATVLEPEILVLDGDGEPIADHEVTVRLFHRQWHSHLRASDFSDGKARYVTDVVDEKILETTVRSTAGPLATELPLGQAGVYVVELEARDRVGRAQTVRVDLYAGGDEPVTWSRPSSKVFTVETTADRHAPGDIAQFILQSPFQRAEVLAVVETPDGNRYRWLPVRGGTATFELEVEPTWVPRLPVHFVLMRGRAETRGPIPGSATDLGKPTTLASTHWLTVEPRDHRVAVTLEHPPKALPGKTIDVTVRLADPDGQPLAGEVTLWLVDQAVLALGQEQRLDPLPDFITAVDSHLWIRDTRDLPFGDLPFAENPGGDIGADTPKGILDRASVRRNFKTVPYYAASLRVGPDGVLTVPVDLPDNLTNFKLRAKAVSGLERFGHGTGHLEVRLPLIVQPALPRFVRPGDRFLGAAIGRVVEGEGGPGAAEISVDGVNLTGESRHGVVWVPNQPRRIDFEVEVPTPAYDADGRSITPEAVFRVGVERASDRASDAFEVRLPIRDDRWPIVRRTVHDLVLGEAFDLPAVEGEARPGTVSRQVLVSSQPALIRMAAGLTFLFDYPHGCTEQRMGRARAFLAMRTFRDLLSMTASEAEYQRAVHQVLEWIPATVDDNQLVGYWPGSRGYVSLTAWTVQFLVEAQEAGFTVDAGLFETLLGSLERAMRSDYRFFIDGESFAERTWALTALTRAGRFDPAYAAELARQAQFLNLESTAQVLRSFVAAGRSSEKTLDDLSRRLWDGVVVRLHQGQELYGGLQRGSTRRNGLILPSESRSLAEVTRALASRAGDEDPQRLQVLVNGLVTLGRGDGWGSTQANTAALLALSEVLRGPSLAPGRRRVEITVGGQTRQLALTPEHPLAQWTSGVGGAGQALLVDAGPASDTPQPTVLRAVTRWIPAADGSTVEAESMGFVVHRELQRIVDGAPSERLGIDAPGRTFPFHVGDVIEDHVQVVNPSDRHYVAITVPLAAGMEPLNPQLATAPPEARPSSTLTLEPSYVAYLDDAVTFYYDSLPKGTYDFHFRLRATVPGSYIQPPALAEMMYDASVRGHGHGARIDVVARSHP